MRAVGLLIDVQWTEVDEYIARYINACGGDQSETTIKAAAGLFVDIRIAARELSRRRVPLLCVASYSRAHPHVTTLRQGHDWLAQHNPDRAFALDLRAFRASAVMKKTFSACANFHVRAFIKKHRADTVLLCGLWERAPNTPRRRCCVTMTAEDIGKLKGVQPVILAELTNGLHINIHTRRRLHGRAGVRIQGLETVLWHLDRG